MMPYSSENPPQVGEMVRVVCCSHHGNPVRKAQVTDVLLGAAEYQVRIKSPSGEMDWLNFEQLEPLSATLRLKTGDRVRVVREHASCAPVSAGDIGTVESGGPDSWEVQMDKPHDGKCSWRLHDSEIELIVSRPAAKPQPLTVTTRPAFEVQTAGALHTLNRARNVLKYHGSNYVEFDFSDAAPLHALLGAYLASVAGVEGGE